MCLSLEKLIGLYNNAKENNNNLFIYDEVENIDVESVHKDGYDINIKRMKTGSIYRVFIFLGKDKEVVFNCPIAESTESLSYVYETLKEDVVNLSLEEIINKYYEKLRIFL